MAKIASRKRTEPSPFLTQKTPDISVFDPFAPVPIHNPALEGIDKMAVRQAWFTAAHLVMEDGAKILDIRCGDGLHTYIMAVQNPQMEFIGIDPDIRAIETAEKRYQRANLKFVAGTIEENFVPKNSLDAVVNSFTLHKIYSENQCNEKAVIRSLERQLELLKPGGTFFFQGHMIPQAGDFLLLEMPEVPSKNNSLEGLNDIELLKLYAQQSRPYDSAYRGFYIEELPPRFPRTRLFRIPAKWAYEFLIRKDQRKNWEDTLHTEYCFFTRHDFKRSLKNMGTRLLYSAPHWDERLIKKSFYKKVRLFDETHTPLGTPETSFVFVAQKEADAGSLNIQERRPADNQDSSTLQIISMRDDLDGRVCDLVTRNLHITEILPYRISEDNRLLVTVHEGLPRCLSNTVPRKGSNIDGKEWSGHMTEALSIPQEDFETLNLKNARDTALFLEQFAGLKPKASFLFEEGPGFYPAPETIDEHIGTYYIQIEKPLETKEPQNILEDMSGFSTKGKICELDAQQILNAIGVGLIPTSRLEIQILALYEKLGLPYQSWADCPLALKTEEPSKTTKLQDIIANLAKEDDRFKPTKTKGGQIKTQRSIFVDEGQKSGAIIGLSSAQKDFIMPEDGSMNTAIILPLTRKINGEVMAGLIEEYLPVPQRYAGNGLMLNCPSFTLPPEIRNFDMARRFIADQFEVKTDCVSRMGESYFSHIGLSPQRIYPFAVSTAGSSGWKKVGRTHGATKYTPLYRLYRLLYWDNCYSFIKVVAMAYQAAMGYDSDLSVGTKFSYSHADRKGSFLSRSSVYSSSSTSLSSSSSSLSSKDMRNE